MPTRIMFHNLKTAQARSVGDSSWLDLTDADGNIVTVFMPKWIASEAERMFTKRLMVQEDMDAYNKIAAEENARFDDFPKYLHEPRFASIKDNEYDP